MLLRVMFALLAAVLGCTAIVPGWAADRGATAEQRQFEAGIRRNIETFFRMNRQIDARALELQISGNTVTIRGEVADRRTHDQVIEAARSTNGVAEVVDQMTIRAPDPGSALRAPTRSAAPAGSFR